MWAAQVIKLSDAVQTLPRQVTSCVHGVASAFLEIGRTAPFSSRPVTAACPGAESGAARFPRGAYCLGKLVWGKGWEELLRILPSHLPHSSGPHPVLSFALKPLVPIGPRSAARPCAPRACLNSSSLRPVPRRGGA